VAEFLSPEWVAALDAAARDATAFADGAPEPPFVVEQRVVMTDGSEHAHHLVLGAEGARVELGRAPHPDIVLQTDWETARALARGVLNAQQALAAGKLRVGGTIETLVDRGDALRSLDDVFAAVRETTTFTAGDAPTVTSAE
jgi:putative sterol carrier protein